MYADDFTSFIDKSVDILIGNESEFYEIFQTENKDTISKQISKMVDIGFMTQGRNGATLFQNKEFDKIITPPINNVAPFLPCVIKPISTILEICFDIVSLFSV